jgi:hypothetical protein
VNGPRERVCCKKGRRDWFTTRSRCRRADGRVIADRNCRN